MHQGVDDRFVALAQSGGLFDGDQLRLERSRAETLLDDLFNEFF